MSSQSKENRVFKALAHPVRRGILDDLRDSPRTTGMLCGRISHLDRCTVMQHLKVLEKAGLIIVRREGRERWNALDPLPIKEIYDRWISRHAQAALDMMIDLKDRLEEDGRD